MQNTINWFIRSSAGSGNYSLTIKSLATLLVLFGLDASIVNDAGNQIINVITSAGMLLSAITALVGIARKVKLGRWNAPDPYSED